MELSGVLRKHSDTMIFSYLSIPRTHVIRVARKYEGEIAEACFSKMASAERSLRIADNESLCL